MADMMNQAPDSAPQGMGMDSAAGEDQAYSVTITANGDGTYTLQGSDADADADKSQPGAPAEASGPQTANGIDEALQLAGKMLADEAGEESDEPQGDANAPVDDPESVWAQLAKKTDAKRQ